MKISDKLYGLAGIWRNSASEEEFRIKVVIDGRFGFLSRTLFRLFLWRNTHRRRYECLSIAVLGAGVLGFSLWGAVVGPESPIAGVLVLLLSLAIMPPITLAMCKFDYFCYMMNAAEKGVK